MIIWSFKDVGMKFRSTPAKHQRDIQKMAKSCGVSPETEIIYHNGNPNRNTVESTADSNGDTGTKKQPAVSKKPKARKPRRKKTTGLSHVSVTLDSTGPIYNGVEGGSGDSDTGSTGDGLAD